MDGKVVGIARCCLSELCVRVNVFLLHLQKRREKKGENKINGNTYNTRRCLSPAKSALVILVRLFAFRSLDREMGKEDVSI